jgi:hypothetical protein
MLFKEVIPVYSENYTNHIYTKYGYWLLKRLVHIVTIRPEGCKSFVVWSVVGVTFTDRLRGRHLVYLRILTQFIKVTLFQNRKWSLNLIPLKNNIIFTQKVKQSHNTLLEAQGERRYSSSFTTSELDGVEWSASRPGRALPPGKGPPVPIGQEAVWAPEPVWTQRLEEKVSCLCRGSSLDRPVVQSAARHYTDWANPAHNTHIYIIYLFEV